jgi:phenylacetate-CoA ligase
MLAPEEDTLEPVETWPVERLRALQTERMRWSLRHAWERVPHYRHAFEDARVHPDDFASLADLRRFPFTTRRDLRAHPPLGLLAVPRERLARVHATSGATGRPVAVGYTPRDIETWGAVMARSVRAAGVRPGWAVLVAHGFGMGTLGFGAQWGAERHGCAVIPVGDAGVEAQVRAIRDLRPEAVMASADAMLAILAGFRAAGFDPAQSGLEVAVLGGGPWREAARAEIEAAFGLRALDCYGLAEMLGPGVAQECVETQDGPTVWEDHFFPEIVDPASGRVLPDGEEGELVLTSLTKEAMPVVRLRTGDLTRLLPGTARTMRRLAHIGGRVP